MFCIRCACTAMVNDEHVVPSANFVDESTRSACSSLKSLSKQLMILNASYGSRDFRTSGPAITRALQQVMTSVRSIQDTLTEAALAMNTELDGPKIKPAPCSLVVSEKEYTFLNAVFGEYMAQVTGTSEQFSLFSSDRVDVLGTAPCPQDSEPTSKNS